ncbi:MAG: M20 aminoacylase family protein [Bauldia sp.]
MPIVNRFSEFQPDLVAWRRDFHRFPEVLYEVHRTAGTVADRLRSFGVDDVVTGIGRTGVVAVIRGRRTSSGRVVGLRADMDALPITETSGMPHASQNPGMMHACGHDGHTTMLLGAARYLAETRNFNGTVVAIFQPAEEGGAGGRAMVDDGLMERFGIEQVFGLHNMPGMPVGTIGTRPGPIMAATDDVAITLSGRGAHAARPHAGLDLVVAASAIVQALQSVVSRTVDPLESVVVSMTKIHIGEATNVIAESGTLAGTVRTLKAEIRDLVEARVKAIVRGVASAYGVTAEVHYRRNYPVTRNHSTETEFAAAVAEEVVGAGNVHRSIAPIMGGEDFSFMLEARPGAFLFIGQGDTPGLHNPAYDFNDEIIPIGCSFWARLAETAMPLDG